MRSYKNTMLIHILERVIDSMCFGLGTRRVKTFLNGLIKSGDNMAYLLRELLECETLNINAKRYNNTMRFDYRESYYAKKSDRINRLLHSLVKSNPCNVVIGYDDSDVSDTDYIIYFEHELFGQISFHCDIDFPLLSELSVFNGEWDGLVNSTLSKLEKAIEKQYGKELDKKYFDIRNTYYEAIREEEMRRENVGKIHKLLNEDFSNMYKLDDFKISHINSALTCYNHNEDLTKYILKDLGVDISGRINVDEVNAKLDSCKTKYLRQCVSFRVIEEMINSFYGKKVKEIRTKLFDDLDNIFKLHDYSIDVHKKVYNNITCEIKDSIMLKILDRYNDISFSSNQSVVKYYDAIVKRFIEDGLDYLSAYFDYGKLSENFIQFHVDELRGLVKRLMENDCDLSVLSHEELSVLYSVYGKRGSKHVFNKNARKVLVPKLVSMFKKKGE